MSLEPVYSGEFRTYLQMKYEILAGLAFGNIVSKRKRAQSEESLTEAFAYQPRSHANPADSFGTQDQMADDDRTNVIREQ